MESFTTQSVRRKFSRRVFGKYTVLLVQNNVQYVNVQSLSIFALVIILPSSLFGSEVFRVVTVYFGNGSKSDSNAAVVSLAPFLLSRKD